MKSWQDMWSHYNIRGFMILSLFLQVLLASTAQLRRQSTSRLIVFMVWSAYFLTDWAATFTFGLISNAQRMYAISPSEVDPDLMALWAAFLLIHLGGPDTITAFSLEDNALWMRQLVGLVAQLFTFFYIFFKTLPNNNFVIPTVLIAVAGAIKYAERTRALHLASMENLKKSTGSLPDKSLDDLNNGDFRDNTSKLAYYFFQIFKGLVIDVMPNHEVQTQSREFLIQKDAKEAFDLMVAELHLLFELFFTKILSINSSWGVMIRIITSYSTTAALVAFFFLKKERFDDVDIWITYALLAGAVALEMTSAMMLPYSNWSGPRRWFDPLWALLQGMCFIIPILVIRLVLGLFACLCGCPQIFSQKWCEKLGAFSLLSHQVGQHQRRKCRLTKSALLIPGTVMRKINQGVSWKDFDKDTQDIIFEELKERASVANDEDKVKEIYEARGSGILTKLGIKDELIKYVKMFDYDRSLIAWHIATEICCNAEGAMKASDHKQRKFAVTLSEYMHYLLIKRPKMMSTVAGIGHIRYHDTCAEVKYFCRKLNVKTANEFCIKILKVDMTAEPINGYKDKLASVLSDACDLARLLMLKDNKWEIISGVWVELLMYAAGHCRPEKHAWALSEGGELVTIVWLMMAHFGIGPHFPYPGN